MAAAGRGRQDAGQQQHDRSRGREARTPALRGAGRLQVVRRRAVRRLGLLRRRGERGRELPARATAACGPPTRTASSWTCSRPRSPRAPAAIRASTTATLTAEFGAPLLHAHRRARDARAEGAALRSSRPSASPRRRSPASRSPRELTHAPGNDAADRRPQGRRRENGWFAARPSGTENIYKIYAESFRGDAHLAGDRRRGARDRRAPRSAGESLTSRSEATAMNATRSSTTSARACGSTTSRATCSNRARSALHRRALGHGPHLEPDDLRPRDQEQHRLRRRRSAPAARRAGAGEAIFFELALAGPDARRRSVPADPRAHGRRRRLGVARGVAAARLRHRGDDRGREGAASRAPRGRTCSSRSPARRRACPRSRRRSSPACPSTSRCSSPASTTSPPPRRSCAASSDASRRTSPRRRLRRVAVRQPLGRRGRAQGAARDLVNRLGIAIAQRAYKAYSHPARLAALAAHLQPGRAPAAPALGQHGHQGPARLRRALHQVARGAASPSTRCRRRRCRRSPTTARSARSCPPTARTCRGDAGALRRGRHRRRARSPPSSARRREVVRAVVRTT